MHPREADIPHQDPPARLLFLKPEQGGISAFFLLARPPDNLDAVAGAIPPDTDRLYHVMAIREFRSALLRVVHPHQSNTGRKARRPRAQAIGQPACDAPYCTSGCPVLINSWSQPLITSVCSGTLPWPVSSARTSCFGARITLYAAYIDVGGQVWSLYPHEYIPGAFNRRAKLTTS